MTGLSNMILRIPDAQDHTAFNGGDAAMSFGDGETGQGAVK